MESNNTSYVNHVTEIIQKRSSRTMGSRSKKGYRYREQSILKEIRKAIKEAPRLFKALAQDKWS